MGDDLRAPGFRCWGSPMGRQQINAQTYQDQEYPCDRGQENPWSSALDPLLGKSWMEQGCLDIRAFILGGKQGA